MSLTTFPQPDNELETGKKVFDFLDRSGLLQIRKSDERFNEWFQNLSYENFVGYLTRLNGILREVPKRKRSIDGESATIGPAEIASYLPPAADQKEGLMRETFNALKHLPYSEDRAMLAYYSLQAIHPYSDGNGRTGRLLYQIISKSGKEINPEQLSQLLDHDERGHSGKGKGRDVFAEKVLRASRAKCYFRREVVKSILGEEYLREYGGIYVASVSKPGRLLREDVDKKLSGNEISLAEQIINEGGLEDIFRKSMKNFFGEDRLRKLQAKYVEMASQEEQGVSSEGILGGKYVKDFPFRGIVLSILLRENASLRECQYEEKDLLDASESIVPEDVDKRISGIDVAKLMPNLSVADVRRLISIHKEVKEGFIRTMIDIFVHPDKHQIKTKDGASVPIKSVFHISPEV